MLRVLGGAAIVPKLWSWMGTSSAGDAHAGTLQAGWVKRDLEAAAISADASWRKASIEQPDVVKHRTRLSKTLTRSEPRRVGGDLV